MEEHGRASDHDPVVVQIDFSKSEEVVSPEVTPNKPENTQGNTSSAVQNITKLSTVNHKGEVKN